MAILVGGVCGAIALAGYWLLGWAVHRRASLGYSLLTEERSVLAAYAVLAGVATLFLFVGVRGIVQAVRDLRDWNEAARDPAAASQPWLRVPQWRRREIVHSPAVSDAILTLAVCFVGAPAAFFIVAGLRATGEEPMFDLFMGAFFVAMLAPLLHARARRARYGSSLCRLRTLPAVPGGSFEADIECVLPEGPGDTIARLINSELAGRRLHELWRMEAKLDAEGGGGRITVPVRLRIPLAREQRPMTLRSDRWTGQPVWMLEIEKKVRGPNFKAKFQVPVYEALKNP